MSTLKDLDISHNLIAEIPTSFVDLKLIEHFGCHGNAVTMLPECEWLRVETVNIMKNFLLCLPTCMNTWMNLRVLNAAENKIGDIDNIGGCMNLEELTMTGNQLSSLPDGFPNLKKLRILHLGRNQLKNDALQLMSDMTEMEELCLYKNKFTQIPPEFSEMRKLRHFNIANNDIKKIPGVLGYWAENIEEVHFSHNDIADFPMTFGACRKLTHLYLGFNPRLASLPRSIAENRNLVMIDLREVNPEFVMPKELASHPRCRFVGIKMKGKGKKKKK